jgi:hypothetical protein
MSSVKLFEESVNQRSYICPKYHDLECDKYGNECRCRRNLLSALKKLSTGAIIGIVVGVVCFFILIILLIVFINRKYNSSSKFVVYGGP